MTREQYDEILSAFDRLTAQYVKIHGHAERTIQAVDELDALIAEAVEALGPAPSPPAPIVVPTPPSYLDACDGPLPVGATYDHGSVGPFIVKPDIGRVCILHSNQSKRNEIRVPVYPNRARVRLRVPEMDNGPVGGSSRAIVCQVHGGDNDGNPPLLSLEYFLRQREWRIYACARPDSDYRPVWSGPFEFGRPVDFRFEAAWHKEDGAIRCWIDDKRVVDLGGPTDHRTSVKPPYLKYGIYYPSAVTDKSAIRRVEFDRVEVW